MNKLDGIAIRISDPSSAQLAGSPSAFLDKKDTMFQRAWHSVRDSDRKESAVAMEQAIFGAETFRFFRDLGRNNSKAWMDENRDRYKRHVVEPFRRLLDALAPGAQKLHPEFCISGRTGENFSRINRDIRFAKDKTPYRTQMYL
ncbi:MAG: DUF2461 family protein, partial [Candidatus Acidiferrales bacterium]